MYISIIIPVYNEEERMNEFLKDLLNYLKSNLDDYEIIIINDGSADNSLKILETLAAYDRHISVISYDKNQGKGHAVKEGILAANGDKIIYLDADGSIEPSQLTDMIRNLNKYDIVIGNRRLDDSIVTQPSYRYFLGIAFNSYVNLLFCLDVNDALCGFKGFKKNIAKEIFKNINSKRWIFDVEILYFTKKNKYNLYQQPVIWAYKKNSKIKFFDPLFMLFQLLMLRLKFLYRRICPITN